MNQPNARLFRRIRVSLKAEHIWDGSRLPVFIENISEQGMHMVTLHKGPDNQLSPGTHVDLKLQMTTGESLPLRCEVRWSAAQAPPDGVTDSVGLRVCDPPPQYVSFVRTFY